MLYGGVQVCCPYSRPLQQMYFMYSLCMDNKSRGVHPIIYILYGIMDPKGQTVNKSKVIVSPSTLPTIPDVIFAKE